MEKPFKMMSDSDETEFANDRCGADRAAEPQVLRVFTGVGGNDSVQLVLSGPEMVADDFSDDGAVVDEALEVADVTVGSKEGAGFADRAHIPVFHAWLI